MLKLVWGIATKSGITSDAWEPWHTCFKAATVWPIARKGKTVGGLLLHGMADGRVMIHLVVKPEWQSKWLNKEIVRAIHGWKPGVDIVAPVLIDTNREPDAPVRGLEKFARLAKFRKTAEKMGEYTLFVKES